MKGSDGELCHGQNGVTRGRGNFWLNCLQAVMTVMRFALGLSRHDSSPCIYPRIRLPLFTLISAVGAAHFASSPLSPCTAWPEWQPALCQYHTAAQFFARLTDRPLLTLPATLERDLKPRAVALGAWQRAVVAPAAGALEAQRAAGRAVWVMLATLTSSPSSVLLHAC